MLSSSLLLRLLPFVGTASAASGSLSFLTLNIAGLPAFLNSNDVPGDKTNNTARIGQLMAKYGYDINHVQEDFNYHATLYANDNHAYRTPTSGGVPFGSGLNTLANFDWSTLTRIKWKQCSIGSGDCLAPKGFTFMRMEVANQVTIDVYNLHTDAGDDSGDINARSKNIKQVVDYINANSQGQAVIVGGDTNSRYTRTGDGIRQFADLAGLQDAWLQLAKGGVAPAEGTDALLCENPSSTLECEIVDKVFYRSGDQVSLEATEFRYAGNDFLQTNGSILTDHDPVYVALKWESS